MYAMLYLDVELVAVELGLIRVGLSLDSGLGRSLGETLERLGVCSNGVGNELWDVSVTDSKHVGGCW
jgi:hypothetical protein